ASIHARQPCETTEQQNSNVARLLRRNLSAQANTVTYDPGRKTGRINYPGQLVINCYQPSAIVAKKGYALPWLRFMRYLVPDVRDRNHLLKWCATLITKPDVRMLYGILAISETQGIGKTTLADILTEEVGRHNCSFPPMTTVTQSVFNTWIAYKRLVNIAE